MQKALINHKERNPIEDKAGNSTVDLYANI